MIKVDVKVKSNTEILKKIQKDISIKIGIFGNSTQATIGAVHEYGTNRAGRGNKVSIPRRSFLNDPINARIEDIKKQMANGINATLQGNGTYYQNMLKVGAYAQGISLMAFKTSFNGQWQVLSKNTIARRIKNSSQPLVNTGALMRSIIYKVEYKL